MAVSTVTPPAAWRRHSTKEFTALALLVALLVFLVHRTTLSRENAELPMNRVLGELEAHCSSAGATLTHLPPAFFGLGVWVDAPALLPGVHAALQLMKGRLAGSATAAEAFPPPTHSLHSFVRVQSSARDAAIGALMREVQDGSAVDAARVTQALEHVASQQQLGMPTLKHAFLPQVGQEVELHGLSLFSVPAELLPDGSAVRCFLADVRQAYCVFPVATVKAEREEEGVASNEEAAGEAGETLDSAEVAEAHAKRSSAAASSLSAASYHTHAASLADEVRAALLSVMARQMGLSTFKPADVAAWKAARERQGCLYTVASVQSTLRSIEANTNMDIPLNTRSMFADLERHVAARAFVRAARAADDLQFHPSLTPQLYIPWDHSIVSQLVILLPMVSMTILALRFVVDERRRQRRSRAATAVTAEKKEQ